MTSLAIFAAIMIPTLPASEYVDTEVSTNVAFSIAADRRYFDMKFQIEATPSNCVEAAFGRDDRTDIIVGWRCGKWIVVDGATGERNESPGQPGNQELDWSLWLSPEKEPRALTMRSGGVELFPNWRGSPPRFLCSADWNRVRVTARGLGPRNQLLRVHFDGGRFRVTVK